MVKKTEERPTAKMPLDIQAQLAAEAAKIQSKIAAPSGDRIRFKANSAMIAPDGSEGDEMEVVIVDFMSTNLYYDRLYDKDNMTPPACFAIGPEPSLLIPGKTSPVRQADTCSACPQNQFGSAMTGKGKACKNTRLVAMTPVDATEADAPIWIMAVPPASIKAFDEYVGGLAVKQHTLPVSVVTKVFLDPSSTYASPRFEVVRPLSNEELPLFFGLRDEANARLSAEPDVTAYEAPKAARGGRR